MFLSCVLENWVLCCTLCLVLANRSGNFFFLFKSYNPSLSPLLIDEINVDSSVFYLGYFMEGRKSLPTPFNSFNLYFFYIAMCSQEVC